VVWNTLFTYDLIFILNYLIILIKLLTFSSSNKKSIFKWFYTLAYFQKSNAVLLFNSSNFLETYNLYKNINKKLLNLPDFEEHKYLAAAPVNGKTYYSLVHLNTDKVDLLIFYHNLFFNYPAMVEYQEHSWGDLYFQAWKNVDGLQYYIYIFWKHENRLNDFWFYL